MNSEHVTVALLLVIIIILGFLSLMTFRNFQTSKGIEQTLSDWTLYEEIN